MSALEGLDQPWSLLAAHATAFEVQETLLGTVYLAHGKIPGQR